MCVCGCSGLHYDWAVNFAAACPTNDSLVAVVGDDPVAQLTDLKSGKPVGALKGHLDYSFAAAWHPDGCLLATGNQVTVINHHLLSKLQVSTLLSLQGIGQCRPMLRCVDAFKNGV